MNCPNCKTTRLTSLQTKYYGQSTVRYRGCGKCNLKFNTIEIMLARNTAEETGTKRQLIHHQVEELFFKEQNEIKKQVLARLLGGVDENQGVEN